MSEQEDTFCYYCQRKFHSPKNLRRHIERKHPGTYAFFNVNLGYSTNKGTK